MVSEGGYGCLPTTETTLMEAGSITFCLDGVAFSGMAMARSLRMLEDGACVRQHFFYGGVCK